MRDYKLRKKVYNDYATKEELENAGGGGGKLVVTATETADTFHLALDKNYSEISAAISNNESVIINWDVSDQSNNSLNIFFVTSINGNESEHSFYIVAVGGVGGSAMQFNATSATGVLMADID